MRLRPTEIDGLLIVESEPQRDERGTFHRIFDAEAFAQAGCPFAPRQSGISHNTKALTLRGLHYQRPPAAQAKLVRCIAGRVFDVALDLRPGSNTYCRWFGLELSAANGSKHTANIIQALGSLTSAVILGNLVHP